MRTRKSTIKSDSSHSNKSPHRPRKRFGQNFLKDPAVIQHIVQIVAPKADDFLVEIGPGRGALTRPLLEIVPELTLIEIDRDIVQLLQSELGSLTIQCADVLKFDFSDLHSTRSEKKLRIIGNLPYNISSPLLFKLLSLCPIIEDMHFMLQKEVVDRITAKPDTKAYGRLSIMVQYFCKTENLFNVPPGAFSPAPKVMSSFVRLVPFETLPYPAKDHTLFKEITNIAFQQRRKTLANSLKSYLQIQDFEALALDPNLRPENLKLESFVNISNFIYAKRSSKPKSTN